MTNRIPIPTDDRVSVDSQDTGSSLRGSDSGLSSSSDAASRALARHAALHSYIQSENPYKGTPFESQYVNIISHYESLIALAEANRKWYEDLGLSRYTEELIAQYTADMYAELRDLDSALRNYQITLPENVVGLQDRAGLNSDLIGLQYSGASGASGSSGGSARSSSLPSSSPASEALMMGLSMIGSITDFATSKLPTLISSIGQIRGVSLDNDLKRQKLMTDKFNQYAIENEYLREFALNTFGHFGFSDDPEIINNEQLKLSEFGQLSMDDIRKISDLPEFIDDDRARSYLDSYLSSENFQLDKSALKNGNLSLARDNAFLSETYGSDFSSMTEFYKILGPLVRDLETLTARFNLNQASYDFNTVSDNVTSEIGVDGSVSFIEQVSDSLDPESATRAVNAGNDRSYYQNMFESDVKEVMQKHTAAWSKKAESGQWWSWIYDLLIMALPQFIQGLSSGSISLFRGGNTVNNSSVTNDYGSKDIVSNRYYDGMR